MLPTQKMALALMRKMYEFTDNPNQTFDDAWLGLGDLSKIEIPNNPMIHRTEKEIENPDLHLMKLLKDPKNVGATCKLLFNIQLHPMQCVILQEFLE